MTTTPDEALISIEPSDATLRRWIDLLTTPSDVWYWDDSLADIDTTGQRVLDRQAYMEAYADIRYTNAYWHWRMPKPVQQLVVADPAWIGSLEDNDRRRVLAKQVELDRGQIFPASHFDRVPMALKPYRVDGKIVLSRAGWRSLNEAEQCTFLRRERFAWDDVECFPVPNDTPAHIKAIANAYGDEHGTNCLSTTAFCITAREEVHRKWMFQPEFLQILAGAGYDPVESDSAQSGDVIVFSQADVPVHAAYVIAPDRMLNKNGQSMFNPVRVVNRAMLDADWADATSQIYRTPGI